MFSKWIDEFIIDEDDLLGGILLFGWYMHNH